MSYCPLNIFSCYTFLSSTLKIEEIFKMCDSKKYPYFGICDLNAMHAYSEINSLQPKYQSQGIFGATITYYLFEEIAINIACYITSEKGYLNLIKIISNYPQGISNKDLCLSKDGLIIVIPTISNNEILYALKEGTLDTYLDEFKTLITGFDDAYFGIEIYTNKDIILSDEIRGFASKNGFKSVAFNHHQYLTKSDAIGLSILQAIKNDTKLVNKTENGPYYFWGSNAINRLFNQDECENTLVISKACKGFNLNIKRGKLLSFPYDGNKKEYLKNLCIQKLTANNLLTDEYVSRLNYELDIIEKMGYLDYFLIVQDYVKFAKDQNIPVGPGRGSSAGSLTSYLLGITDVDSLKYNLLFERFLNPMRTSMPDIDIDFADYRRDEIITYLKNKYGKQKIANIITFQTLGAKACIRDVGRVFNIDIRDLNNISNLIGTSPNLDTAIKNSSQLEELYQDSYFKEIIDLAKKIEGLPRQSGMHAAGVIINEDDLDSSVPIIKLPDGSIITQYDATFLEKQGYLKMDILGLTNLTIIESMCKYIKTYYDSSFDLNSIPLNDQKTFKILNDGLTASIFQLESSGITKALKEVKINHFDDIVVTLALYRPGPMENIPLYAKNKNEKVDFNVIHPLLKPILSSTYGVIIYQEQIMQIVQKIAGFNLGQADLFRRAISKKDASKLQELKNEFISGALNNNIDLACAEKVFNLIERFANYGFNKAHSVSYAIITYQMAFIKANYPLAFYASILNHITLNDPKMTHLKKEFQYFNIELALPSISHSRDIISIYNNKLVISFSKIKGVNKQIIANLELIQKQSPKDFSDFMRYAEEYQIPETAIISLINAGVFDEYKFSRKTLRNMVSSYRLFYQNIANEGLLTKDELMDFLPIIEPLKEDEMLKYDLEYQTLGIILSGSMMKLYQEEIINRNIISLKEQFNKNIYYKTSIAVIVNRIKVIKTKKQEQMAILYCQDDTAEIEVIVFPRAYDKYRLLLKEKNAYIIDGTFRNENDEISFIFDNAVILEAKK